MTSPARAWATDERTMFALAQRDVRWLTTTYDAFWHPDGNEYVTAWPIRLHWGLWWMPEPRPQPATPVELAAALRRFPPREEGWPCGVLMDAEATVLVRRGGPRVLASGPVLEAGTRVRSGRSCPDFCDGFDSQEALVVSGPWSGTPVSLQIGRAGEPYLIGRLALMPEDEQLVADAAAAADLLGRLRDVERNNPS